jgi:uncharacterized damage-inducible protein DinB
MLPVAVAATRGQYKDGPVASSGRTILVRTRASRDAARSDVYPCRGSVLGGSVAVEAIERNVHPMNTALTHFFRHNTWANLRLLDACMGLSEAQLDAGVPGTYGSIRDTLVHLTGAQQNYLRLLTGEESRTPLRRGDPFPGVDDLRQRMKQSSEALTVAATTVAPDTILQGTRGGNAYEVPASVVLLQVINHAIEHRAQIATILTQQGITPPEMDSWTYHASGADR